MASRLLPEGKELPIEADVFMPLLRAAIATTLTELRRTKVEVKPASGFVWADGRFEEAELEVPKYDCFQPDQATRPWQTSATKDLADYVWSRGALKIELMNDNGEPTKENWSWFTWNRLVLAPLRYLASRAALRDLTLERSHVQWSIPDEVLEDAIAELVGLATCGDIILFATCPLLAIHLGRLNEELDSFALGEGVVLSEWSWTQEQAVFMSQHAGEYRRDEGLLNSRALQIRVSVPASVDPLAAISEIVDKVKWAFMIAGGAGAIVHELPIVVHSASGHARDVLRRGNQSFGLSENRAGRQIGWVQMKGWRVLNADPTLLNCAKKALAAFDRIAPSSEDLSDAVWAFGRSCVASLARDALLDAVIGLERLLVPDEPGQTTYKFRLHGQAVLNEESDVFQRLGSIYSLRSAAAHGGKRSRARVTGEEMTTTAPQARYLLAKAISSVLGLLENGELHLGTDASVASAVAALVRARVSLTAQTKAPD